jgi:hypothetical protein
MDAPLSEEIKKILKDREATRKLMKATIAGARNGYSEKIELDGKKYQIKDAVHSDKVEKDSNE